MSGKKPSDTADSSIPLVVSIVSSSLLLIGPSKNCNMYHMAMGKEPGRVRSPLWGTPSQLVCHLILINLETISNHGPAADEPCVT